MLDELYKNIGEKIKAWAKWIFIAEAIAAIIGGLLLIFDGEGLIGIIILIAGPFVAWVSSWLLYAFGELVEKTVANESNTRNILKIMQDKERYQVPQTPGTQTSGTRPTYFWRCENCGRLATQSPCEYCGNLKLLLCSMQRSFLL